MMNSEYLLNLNENQKEAVSYLDGPLLIVAGAGSGKTRVLTHKIAYLVENMGMPPENILAVTFTNKAASEMKNRVEKLIDGFGISKINIGTFHSICALFLRSPFLKSYSRSSQRYRARIELLIY